MHSTAPGAAARPAVEHWIEGLEESGVCGARAVYETATALARE